MDTKEELVEALKDIWEDAPHYTEAKSYYEGEVDEFFAHPKVRSKLVKSSRTYRANFAKSAVNSIADRLELTTMAVPESEEYTIALRQRVWADNQLDLWIPNIFQKTGMYGDGYWIVEPRTDSSNVITGVLINWNSPQRMRAFYDPEDNRSITHAVKWWPTSGGGKRANYYFPDRIEKYVTLPKMDGTKAADWTEYREDPEDPDSYIVENPWGMNVFHMRNDFPYGRPDHYDAYGPQNALNKITGTTMDAVDYTASPQRYALAADAPIEDRGVGSTEGFGQFADAGDLTSEEVAAEDEVQNYESSPDKVHIFDGMKSVGTFPTAEPKGLLDAADWWAKAMAQTTETPLHRMFPSGDRPSGESLRVEEAPLVKRIEHRQKLYGAVLKDMLEFALRMLLDLKEAVRVDLAWKPAASYDDKETWEVATAKQEAGVPQGVALMEAGYEPETVRTWENAKDFDRHITRLTMIGEAVANLSAGVGSNLLTPEVVQQLMQPAIDAAQRLIEEDEQD